MAVHRSQRRCQQNGSNHDEQHRIGMTNVKVSVAQFAQQEEDTERCDHRRAHEVADRASWTSAAGRIAHRRIFLQLLLPSRKPVAEHIEAHTNQNQRPESPQPDKIKKAKIIEQQQCA